MDEVPGAQVLHAAGNVHHEPDQGLQGQALVGRQGKLRLGLSTQLGQGKWGSPARKPEDCPQHHQKEGERGTSQGKEDVANLLEYPGIKTPPSWGSPGLFS